MICKKCGAENAEGAKFCQKCGAALDNAVNEAVPVSQAKKKLSPQMMIGAGAAVAVVLVIIIIAALTAKPTIKLDQYLTIETEGYDGYGRARAVIDWDGIEEKFGSKITYTSTAKKELREMTALLTPFELFQECVTLNLSQSNKLSNGTSITYTWNVADDISEYLKCKVKYSDGEYTVSGLTEVGKFDAFADLSVEFYGVAPNGTANLNYTGSKLVSYNFSCDKTSGLKNGDIVTVTIDENIMENCAQSLGEVPAELEKEYVVEGLQSYAASLNEIDEETMEQLKKQGDDVFRAYVANKWDDNVPLQALDYIGSYFLTAKNPNTTNRFNQLYLVYKAQTRVAYSKDEKSFDQAVPHYWYIRYDDLMLEADGTIQANVIKYETPSETFTVNSGISNGWFSTFAWKFYGFEDLGSLYKTVVEKNLDAYNHEDRIDESNVTVITQTQDTAADGNEGSDEDAE